ncbi:hypothetical protein F4680DRAFT_453845 [Xylaria scruposa]|nr:hypothetical protein F4680DRAFT_453845 [Xylaria scruposa]
MKGQKTMFNLQLYTRKWCNFSEHQTPNHPITLLPGALGRLPPEIRFMIYDILMPPRNYRYYGNGRLMPAASFPKIAHVCREMRQYASQRYRFIQSIRKLSRGGDIRGFGVFDPKRDSIFILERAYERAYDRIVWIQNATVQWDDAFQEPTVTNISSRTKRYSRRNSRNQWEVGPEGEIWEIEWDKIDVYGLPTLLQ